MSKEKVLKSKNITLYKCKYHQEKFWNKKTKSYISNPSFKWYAGMGYSRYCDRREAQECGYVPKLTNEIQEKSPTKFVNYDKYMSYRTGSLGVKDINHKKINLENLDVIKNYPVPALDKNGNRTVWDQVISFNKETTQHINPNFFEQVINVVKKNLLSRKNSGLELDKLNFEYAVHVNTEHIHCHIKFFVKDKFEKLVYDRKSKSKVLKTYLTNPNDVRATGKLGQKYLNKVKFEIMTSLYLSESKVNPYNNKLVLKELFEQRARNVLIRDSTANDFMMLINQFYDSQKKGRKSFRYDYITKEEKMLIDQICENILLHNLVLLNTKDKFIDNIQKTKKEIFDLSVNESQKNYKKLELIFNDIVSEKITEEKKNLNKELANIVLKILKENKSLVNDIKVKICNLAENQINSGLKNSNKIIKYWMVDKTLDDLYSTDLKLKIKNKIFRKIVNISQAELNAIQKIINIEQFGIEIDLAKNIQNMVS